MALERKGDCLESKSGGGVMMLFGLFFMLPGLGIIAAGFLGGGGGMPILFALPFGGIFAAVGAAFVFGRKGTRIDLIHREVTDWWSCLFLGNTTRTPLDQFTRVSMSREVRRTKNSSYTVYPVRLEGKGDPINLDEPRNLQKARAMAEELAKAVELPLADRSSGEEIVRDADKLDETVRDRVKREGRSIDVPPAPPGQKCAHRGMGNDHTFVIPPTGLNIGHYIMMGAVGFFVLFGCGMFAIPMLSGGRGGGIPLVFVGFFGVFFVLMPIAVVGATIARTALASTTVEVSASELRVTVKTPFGTSTKVIPSNELEELEVVEKAGGAHFQAQKGVQVNPQAAQLLSMFGGGAAITARSDHETLRFGAGLSVEEVRWMKAVIEKAVSS